MRIIVLLIFLSLLFVRGHAETRFVNTSGGTFFDVKDLSKELLDFDVIFFGEMHTIEPVHRAQAELSHALADVDPALMFSFEMWERDTQDLMDKFLAGELEEDRFVEESRAWGNYDSYRPMLMLAQERNLKVIAANIPRDYATRVSREGWDFVWSLPDLERRWIAQKLTAPEDEYKKEFFGIMTDMGDHEMKPEDLENYYRAQCIKDDTMAESIALYLKEHPGHRLMHFNGDFHSRAWRGTVSRLQELMPGLRIAVISPEIVDDLHKPVLPDDMAALASHLLILEPPIEEGER
jgi:uncharacterized iron-regulated protein